MEEIKLDVLENAVGGVKTVKKTAVGTCFEYTVVAGDTLGKLAKKYGTTVPVLMSLNPIIKNKNLIRVGWQIWIPMK